MILKQIEQFTDKYGTLYNGTYAVTQKVEYFNRMLKVMMRLFASKDYYKKEIYIPTFEININISKTAFEQLMQSLNAPITWEDLIDSIKLDDKNIISSNSPELLAMLLQYKEIDCDMVTKKILNEYEEEKRDENGEVIKDAEGNPEMVKKTEEVVVPVMLGEKFEIVQSLE